MSKDILVRKEYNHESSSRTFATKKEVQSLLREDITSNKIKEKINYISDENCNIEGSKELIKLFKSINLHKYDYTLPINNIEYIDYTNDEINLQFKVHNEDDVKPLTFKATGHYHATGDFLDRLFQLKNFANYCRKNNHNQLLDTILKELMSSTSDNRQQYRFIEPKKNEILLRGITSTRYRYYDNDLIIYISLNALNQYSERKNKVLYIKKATITDSNLNISINMKETFPIDKNIKVEVGVKIYNNEIKEGSFSIEFIYTLIDENGNKASAIGEKVLTIPHILRAETISSRLDDINKFDDFTTDIIDAIKSVNTSKKLTKEQLYKIFDKLSHATQKLSKETRERIDKLNVTENTYTLIKIFNKLEDISSTVDERTFIQSKLNDFITNKFR